MLSYIRNTREHSTLQMCLSGSSNIWTRYWKINRNLIKDGFQEKLTLRAKAWKHGWISTSLNITPCLHQKKKKKREKGGESTESPSKNFRKIQFTFCKVHIKILKGGVNRRDFPWCSSVFFELVSWVTMFTKFEIYMIRKFLTPREGTGS